MSAQRFDLVDRNGAPLRVLNNIPRLSGLDVATFQRDFVSRYQPVILTGLHDKQAIRELSTIERVREKFGHIQVVVRQEYLSRIIANLSNLAELDNPTSEEMSIAEYLDFIVKHPASRKMVIEQDTPSDILSTIQAPEYFPHQEEDQLISKSFIGNAGDCAHLHFDRDNRQVLFYQVFGIKRITLIPPRASHKLIPFGNFSSVYLQNFREDDKYDFLTYIGAFDTLIYPGEVLYMPALIWHYIEYLSPSMSINFRYPRAAANRFIGTNTLVDADMQRLAARIATDPTNEQACEAFARLQKAYASETEPASRLHAVSRTVQEICEKTWGDPPIGKYFLPHSQLSEYWMRCALDYDGRYRAALS